MPEDIHFHARKSTDGTSVNLEIWKGMHMLGAWVITPDQSWDLSVELTESIPVAPPPTNER